MPVFAMSQSTFFVLYTDYVVAVVVSCRSEANDLALRLARHHTKNTEILTLDR